MKQNLNSGDWVKVDELQWRKQLTETMFHLVEVRECPEEYIFVTGIIDISDYEKDINSYINGYGYKSVENMKSIYQNETNGVIAECIFESMCNMELTGFGGFDTETEAEESAIEYMRKQ